MICKYGVIIGVIMFVFETQTVFASEPWLVITSDLPGAAVSVDGIYRGVLPQQPGDALRIQLTQGTHEIDASVSLGGKDYVTRHVVEVQANRENLVQINLRQEIAHAPTSPTALPGQVGRPQLEMKWPLDELEVPGRNF